MCILSWVLEYFISKLLVEVYNECVGLYDLPARDTRNAEREGGGCAGECHTKLLGIICIVYCSDDLREVKVLVHAYITPFDSHETLLVDVELPNNRSVSAHVA